MGHLAVAGFVLVIVAFNPSYDPPVTPMSSIVNPEVDSADCVVPVLIGLGTGKRNPSVTGGSNPGRSRLRYAIDDTIGDNNQLLKYHST